MKSEMIARTIKAFAFMAAALMVSAGTLTAADEAAQKENYYFPVGDSLQPKFSAALKEAAEDPAKGEAAFRKLLADNPKLYQAMNDLGVALWRKGDKNGAIEQFNQALDVEPLYYPAIRNLMAVYIQETGYDKTIAFLEGLSVRRPNSVRIKLMVAEVYALRNKGDDADKAKEIALEIAKKDERNYEARYVLALAYYQNGKFELADMVLDTALTQHADYPEAIFLRALIFFSQKRVDAAKGQLSKLLEISDGYPTVRNIMGVFLLSEENYKEALEYFNKAIALNPDFADAYLNKGTALRAMGNYDEALAAYKKALSLNPAYYGAALNIAVLSMERIFDAADIKQTTLEIIGALKTVEEVEKTEEKVSATIKLFDEFFSKVEGAKGNEAAEFKKYAESCVKELKDMLNYCGTAKKRIKDRIENEKLQAEELKKQQEEEAKKAEELKKQQEENQTPPAGGTEGKKKEEPKEEKKEETGAGQNQPNAQPDNPPATNNEAPIDVTPQ